MNKTLTEAMEFAIDLQERRGNLPADVDIMIAPPALYLASMETIKEPVYQLAAQNCSHHSYGAFTGEISPAMLESMRIGYALVGHSERRTYYFETDELLAKKIYACFLNRVIPVFCCGEQLNERNENRHFITVLHQLERALYQLTPEQMEQVIVAYEPVWAIGTGVTATTEQVQEMHKFIRQSLAGHFGQDTAQHVRILYGGSVNAANSAELFSCEDVDGGLVGGASLKVNDFVQIIRSASKA